MSSKSTTTSSSNQTETETVVEQVRTRTEREKTIEEQALDALIRGMHLISYLYIQIMRKYE